MSTVTLLQQIIIFYRNLGNFLQGNKINSTEAVQAAFKDFIDPHSNGLGRSMNYF